MSKGLTPYQRIVRKAAMGGGVYLSHEETQQMADDVAIIQQARNDDEFDDAAKIVRPIAKACGVSTQEAEAVLLEVAKDRRLVT